MSSKRFVSILMAILAMITNTANALTCPPPIDSERSLLIRDLSVVEDPIRTAWTGSTKTASDGAWSFGRLMTNMAGQHNPSNFVRNWLANWEADRIVNRSTVPARPSIVSAVIDPWPKSPNGKLDLTKAPMRLLTIVYRPDLRDRSKRSGGEGRFVFGVLDSNGSHLPFTVILEYTLLAKTKAGVLGWALAFQRLSTLEFGAAFNSALEAITNRFAGKGVAKHKINGSSINQVRTNEIALDSPWELREFRLRGRGKTLTEVTVRQTPSFGLNNTAILAKWIDANTDRILSKPGNGSIEVPLFFNGVPFLAGAIANNIDVWDSTATNGEAKFRVALNTCNGCHGAETSTSFLHINPRDSGSPASLSGFLTGSSVIDPRDGTTVRDFNELEFRKAEVDSILCP